MVKGGMKKKKKNKSYFYKLLIIGILTLIIAFFAIKLLFTGKTILIQHIDNSPPLCIFHFGDTINLDDTNLHSYKLRITSVFRSFFGYNQDLLSFQDYYSGTPIYTTFVSNTTNGSMGFISLGGNSYPVYLEGPLMRTEPFYNITIFSVNGTSISCNVTTTCQSSGQICNSTSECCSSLNCTNGTCAAPIVTQNVSNNQSVSNISNVSSNTNSVYIPTPIIGNVGTISKGTYNNINGISILVTDILQNSSFPNQTFITFIAGSEMNLANINSPVDVNLNGKIYTIKLVSTSNSNVSINLFSNSRMNDLEQIEKNIPADSPRTETEQIEKNNYLPYNNFTDLDFIYKGQYVVIGNGSSKDVLKLVDAGYPIYGGGNMQLALFSYVFQGWSINTTWSGWGGTFPSGNIYRAGYVVLSDSSRITKYYLTVIQGNAGLDPYSYNVSIEPYIYIPRYTFYRGFSVIYKTMNNPAIFVKNTNSTNSSSIIAGNQMFLASESNRTKFVVSGNNYAIELVAFNSTDATFNVTNIGTGTFIDNAPTGCTPGATKQKDCSSQNTACITYPSVTITCLPSGTWDDPSCNLTYSKRGTDCNGDGWHACDGNGTCQGWKGSGCGSCPWGSSNSVCNMDTTQYATGVIARGFFAIALSVSKPVCESTSYGWSGCCKRTDDASWIIKPK